MVIYTLFCEVKPATSQLSGLTKVNGAQFVIAQETPVKATKTEALNTLLVNLEAHTRRHIDHRPQIKIDVIDVPCPNRTESEQSVAQRP